MNSAAIAVLITDPELVTHFANNPECLAEMLDDVKNRHIPGANQVPAPVNPLSIFREPPQPDLYGSNRDTVTDAISDMRDAIEDVVASIEGLRDALTTMARHAYQQHGMELVRIGSELVDAYSAARVALLGDDSSDA